MNQVIDKRKTVELSKLEPKTLSDWVNNPCVRAPTQRHAFTHRRLCARLTNTLSVLQAQCKSCSNWWRVSKGMFNWAQKNDWYCRHIGYVLPVVAERIQI